MPSQAVNELTHEDGRVEQKQLMRRTDTMKSSLVATVDDAYVLLPAAVKHYTLNVHTGDVWRAGTDANVYMIVYGERGDSGKRQLKHSQTHRNKFERRQLDVFDMEAADLGRLNKITIGHDSAGMGCACACATVSHTFPRSANWFLSHVEIVDTTDNNRAYAFNCERWLAVDKDDGAIERALYEKVIGCSPHPDDPEKRRTTTRRTTRSYGVSRRSSRASHAVSRPRLRHGASPRLAGRACTDTERCSTPPPMPPVRRSLPRLTVASLAHSCIGSQKWSRIE